MQEAGPDHLECGREQGLRASSVVLAVGLLCTVLCAQSTAHSEDEFNDSLCRTISGTRETRHYFTYGDGRQSHVVVDCESDFFVIKGGLDGRSSLDSLQQALFFSVLTGKSPAVVIYDTDERVSEYEHRIQAASEKAGVLFLRLRLGHTTNSQWLNMVFGR